LFSLGRWLVAATFGALAALGSPHSTAQVALPSIATASPVDASFFWPNPDYDPSVPTIRSVLGYQSGQRITTHADAGRYLRALAANQPERVRIISYGRSWQGRDLIYAVIGTPDQIRRLDDIKSGMQRLADPRTTSASEASQLITGLPAIVWMTYTVHGNEPSGTDAALMTAYHLLAARNDPRIEAIRQNALVVINPVQNPDGRDRFISNSTQNTGLAPDPNALAAERDEAWPSGRQNHYNIDLNRDWFAQTQPETIGQAAALLEWRPLVLADVHEMGTNQTYFFPPEADPLNPNITQAQKDAKDRIARTTAGWFDRVGVPYFTRETFDAFYPGYGDGWPTYQGVIAMTYEQGSSRGLVARRADGSTLSYAETVRNHFVASMSTIESSARDREALLRGFYDYRRTAVEEGRREATKAYALPPQLNQMATDRLAALLARQGIEVTRTNASARACGRTLAAGSYVISMAQPSKRLIKVLMEENTPLDPAFAERQRARLERGVDDEIYDVTAWSLPHLFGVDTLRCGDGVNVAGERVSGSEAPRGGVANPDAKVAFVAAAGTQSTYRLVAAALQSRLVPRFAEEGFTIDGNTWPAGSIIFAASENPEDLSAKLQRLAASTGAFVTGYDTSYVTSGPSFGSSRMVRLTPPRIALAWDTPTDRTAAGATRFVLEQRYGWPVTVVRTSRLRSASLSGFDVLIMPDEEASYSSALGSTGAANIKGFVERGGVLITMAGATRWAADPDVGLLSSRLETAVQDVKPTVEDAGDASTVSGTRIDTEADYRAAIEPSGRSLINLDGVMLRGVPDRDHWLTAGVAAELFVVMSGTDVFRPLTLAEGANPVRFAGPGRVVAGGQVWDENRQQLAFKPFVMVEGQGRGSVIAFTADPTWRGQAEGLDPLLLNAIFAGPAFTRR
jgi:hypothetical protein